MTEKECFIIMPITTPPEFISSYKDDCEHFLHIMHCLFKPAIEKAGFKPILPVTQGSEIIHGEIISKIESSDLVLCDMSILNPNVFFELGIRTALNKPVCLIKDNIIEKVPFDTGIINYHVYSPDLSSWIVKNEIEKLARHINESFSKSDNFNSLWKYFGLKSIGTPPKKSGGDMEKIDYLTMQVEAIRRQLDEPSDRKPSKLLTGPHITIKGEICDKEKISDDILRENEKFPYFYSHLQEILSGYEINLDDMVKIQRTLEGKRIVIIPGKRLEPLPLEVFQEICKLSNIYGIQLKII